MEVSAAFVMKFNVGFKIYKNIFEAEKVCIQLELRSVSSALAARSL